MEKNIYDIEIKEELGVEYSKESSIFKIWSPFADNVYLNFYKYGEGDSFINRYELEKNDDGLWRVLVEGDLEGIYYTYTICHAQSTNEVVDIYAKALGLNGERGMIVDLSKTNPEGFYECKPQPFKRINDAVIYEVHIRDFSICETSGMENKGKFLALTKEGTKNIFGDSTGIDHIKQLGITHVHLLPIFDYATVNEAEYKFDEYNWGYDPKNYNTPEGSYATNSNDGYVRIKEFKELVMALHKNNIRVVMDVVYNHTYMTENSFFNHTVPDYYYRKRDGKFTNGSGCGNETASEHLMMRKFILDSVKYWAKEYMIDGFRFDLMGLHDIETMNLICDELEKIDEDIIVYGEGWVGGDSALPYETRAVRDNCDKTPKIAYFNDIFRDVVKGNVFNFSDKGYANGGGYLEESVKLSVLGCVENTLIDYSKTQRRPFAKSPKQVINYIEAHDNLTLWDKLYYSCPHSDERTREDMDKLAASIVFLSQGIPFIQAGQEFLRSKPSSTQRDKYEENSYNLSDFTNSIKWTKKSKYKNIFNYYKGLIELRKNHILFRLDNAQEIDKKITFLNDLPPFVVGYKLRDENEEIVVIFNPSNEDISIEGDFKGYKVYVNKYYAGNKSIFEINEEKIFVQDLSAYVLIKG